MEYRVQAEGLETPLFVIDPNTASPLSPGTDVAVGLAPSGMALVPPR